MSAFDPKRTWHSSSTMPTYKIKWHYDLWPDRITLPDNLNLKSADFRA